MSEDRILLTGMRFQARHGVHERERRVPQRFEADVELRLDLGPAGRSDDLGQTVDYSAVYETVRSTVEGESFALIEALAETIAARVLVDRRIEEVRVRVRKPEVELGGPLDHASVEIVRRQGR